MELMVIGFQLIIFKKNDPEITLRIQTLTEEYFNFYFCTLFPLTFTPLPLTCTAFLFLCTQVPMTCTPFLMIYAPVPLTFTQVPLACALSFNWLAIRIHWHVLRLNWHALISTDVHSIPSASILFPLTCTSYPLTFTLVLHLHALRIH